MRYLDKIQKPTKKNEKYILGQFSFHSYFIQYLKMDCLIATVTANTVKYQNRPLFF